MAPDMFVLWVMGGIGASLRLKCSEGPYHKSSKDISSGLSADKVLSKSTDSTT